MKVIKRDGTTVDFDPQKIVVAIEKANAAVEEQCRISESKIKEIAAYVQGKNRPRLLVEDIQDIVERQLQEAAVTAGRWCVNPIRRMNPSLR